MKPNTKWLIICFGIVLIGVILFAYQEQIGVGKITPGTVLIQRGILVHNPQSVPTKDWMLEYQDDSAQTQYIALSFDSQSLCADAALIETCNLNKYQSGQSAQIEGYLQNGQFYVVRMIVMSGN